MNIKTIDEHKITKKSSAAILCELTRLKSQQKYLECTQLKLNPKNFADEYTDASIRAIVREIEDLKIMLAIELEDRKASAKRDVKNMWIFVNAIRDDVLNMERLKQFTVQSIGERIFSINSMLETLTNKNRQILQEAQRLFVQLESDAKTLLKRFDSSCE